MFYEITALDTLFFRDAAPFTAMTDIYAKSLFPPLPSVYAGALRSCYFSYHMDEFHKANETEDPTKGIKLGLTCLKQNNNFLFPRPLDAFVRKKEDNNSFAEYTTKTMNLRKISQGISSYPLDYIFEKEDNDDSSKDVESPHGFFMTYNELLDYLNGKSEPFQCQPLDDFISDETRVGIQINKHANVTQESMLYQIKSIRPEKQKNEKISLCVEATGIELPQSAMIKLGGKSKVSQLLQMDEDVKFEIKHSSSKYFKLYFATPAIFKNGWLPSWKFNEEWIATYEKNNLKIKIKLIAAAIGRYIGVGGFDMKTRLAKEMRYAIPAGSVYYFELIDGSIEDVLTLFHQHNLSDNIRENEGFGYCLVGEVKGGF